MIVGAFVLVEVTAGITEASMTRCTHTLHAGLPWLRRSPLGRPP